MFRFRKPSALFKNRKRTLQLRLPSVNNHRTSSGEVNRSTDRYRQKKETDRQKWYLSSPVCKTAISIDLSNIHHWFTWIRSKFGVVARMSRNNSTLRGVNEKVQQFQNTPSTSTGLFFSLSVMISMDCHVAPLSSVNKRHDENGPVVRPAVVSQKHEICM